jgi:putative aminopeptidase FrvX
MAHQDSVGFLVSGYNEDGSLKIKEFEENGILHEAYIGEPIVVKGNNKEFITTMYEQDNVNNTGSYFKTSPIFSGPDLAEAEVALGSPVYVCNPLRKVKGSKAYTASCLDNKVGVLSIIILMSKLYERTYADNLHFVLTSHEEASGQSAISSVTKIKPHVCINIDTYEVEEVSNKVYITVGSFINKVLSNMAISLARQKNIPYGIEVCPSTTHTDLDEIFGLNGGIPCCNISIPIVGLHGPKEKVLLEAIDNSVELVYHLLLEIEKTAEFNPGGKNGL